MKNFDNVRNLINLKTDEVEEAKSVIYNNNELHITLRLPLIITQRKTQADIQQLINTLYDKYAKDNKMTWDDFFNMISQKPDKNSIDFQRVFEEYDEDKKGYLTCEEFSELCLKYSEISATIMNTMVSALPDKDLVLFRVILIEVY